MTSTFPQQILNVPPELVAQGWRREPTEEVKDSWRAETPTEVRRWEALLISTNEPDWIYAYRPVVRTIDPEIDYPGIYAHQGWGEGLSPTPEMVKVWRWWWMRGIEGLQPVYVYVRDGEIIAIDGLNSRHIDPTEWAGPVLPTHGGTSCPLTSQFSESTSKQKEPSP